MPGSNGRRAQDKAEDKDRGQGALENTDWTSAPRWPIWSPKTQLSETEGCLCPLQIFSFSLCSHFEEVQYNPVGLPLWLSWWRICLQCGRSGFNPWIEISPGEGKGYPLQYSGLENSMDCIVLLLLLSRFSRVRLCETPQTAAHQAPPSLGFSRQEHWSGLPFPSLMHESEKWKWSHSVVSNS